MTVQHDAQIWFAHDPRRYFLLSDVTTLPPGDLVLRSGDAEIRVHPEAVDAYEVSEEQAHRWTKAELGSTLTDLRASLDETLAGWRAKLDAARNEPVAPDTPVTPNAVPALFDFLRALPAIVGQSISGDDARLATARQTLADLQQKLASSGIELDERFTGYADRLADLRRDAEEKRDTEATRDATTPSTADQARDDDAPPDGDDPPSPGSRP